MIAHSSREGSPPDRTGGAIFFLGLAAFASLVLAAAHLAASHCAPGSTLDLLMRGEARLPYQYRALIPMLMRGALSIPLVRDLLERIAQTLPSFGWTLSCGGGKGELLAFVLLIEWAALLGMVLAMHRLFTRGGMSKFWAGALSLTTLAALAEYYVFPPEPRFWYASDLPAVLFFVSGILLILERRYALLTILMPFATLNRETTIFLVILLFLEARGDRTGRRHAALQLTIWILAKIGLLFIFAGNRGAPVHPNALDNFGLLFDGETWRGLVTGTALMTIPLVLAALSSRDVSAKNLARVVVLFIFGMFLVGHLPELRIYGEVVPVAVLIAAVEGRRWHREKVLARNSSGGA